VGTWGQLVHQQIAGPRQEKFDRQQADDIEPRGDFRRDRLRAVSVMMSLAAVALSWGPDGHYATAMVATKFLTTHTVDVLKKIIPDGNLTAVVDWADQVKSESQWKWSAPLHFLNTKDDDPPKGVCSLVMSRDCPPPLNFCVVGAIMNFSADTIASNYEPYALQFLIHFIGDVHQPLHVTGYELGGLDTTVDFFDEYTDLHSVWDTSMIERQMGTYSNGLYSWVDELLHNMSTVWADQVDKWTTCNTTTSPICPIEWAVISNHLVCSAAYVFPSDESAAAAAADNQEAVGTTIKLSYPYYDANIPIVNLRIAQAGARMANVLNYALKNLTGLSGL